MLLFEANRTRWASRASTSAIGAGLVLIGFGLLQSVRMAITDVWFLKILALSLFAGVVLACHGWRGLAGQWRSGAVILIMVLPEKCLPLVEYAGMLTIAHAGLPPAFCCIAPAWISKCTVMCSRPGPAPFKWRKRAAEWS